jgi:hypothetical protein
MAPTVRTPSRTLRSLQVQRCADIVQPIQCLLEFFVFSRAIFTAGLAPHFWQDAAPKSAPVLSLVS